MRCTCRSMLTVIRYGILSSASTLSDDMNDELYGELFVLLICRWIFRSLSYRCTELFAFERQQLRQMLELCLPMNFGRLLLLDISDRLLTELSEPSFSDISIASISWAHCDTYVPEDGGWLNKSKIFFGRQIPAGPQ